MSKRRFLARFQLAIATAALASFAFASASFAQSTSTGSGPYVVRVESPASGAAISGNVAFTGLAADCGSFQPATRVSIYDGPSGQGRLLGDAGVNLIRERDDACLNQAGAGPIGWSLILDTRRLTPGFHALTIVAHFSNGATSSVSHQVNVQYTPGGHSYGNGSAVWYNGGYWVNGSYVGPNYVPTIYYANQCASYTANGVCLGYQNVATTNLHNGVRGYYTCNVYPTYRCNYTRNNGGVTVNR
jgi:hypothetical protein